MQQRAYALLRDMIEQGRIRPGERLLEAQVAKAFGISRSPARHALQALCDARLLREAAGRGYQVPGRGRAAGEGQIASLEVSKITPLPQWERMYKGLEQELCIRVLFGSVRITEERLAEHFGVSRTVVRDVLGRMHSAGLVTKDSLGHWIAERMTPNRIRDLFQLRYLLEPEALRQSAPLVPRDQLERTLAALEHMLANYPAEIAAIDRAETDLHIDLLSHCPNREITQALKRTHLLFAPTRHLFDPFLKVPSEVLQSAFLEHRQIVELLLLRKIGKAAVALHEHLKEADSRWLQRFEYTARMTQLQFPSYLAPIP